MCHSALVKVRGQLSELDSLLLLGGFFGWNSGFQACVASVLPAESFHCLLPPSLSVCLPLPSLPPFLLLSFLPSFSPTSTSLFLSSYPLFRTTLTSFVILLH